MDNIPQLGTAADLEQRAGRVADPGLDLRTRHAVACELREMIDTVRDAEAGRVFPHMIPALLDLLRGSEAAFHKDTPEYQFRRVILEILHRLTTSEGTRSQAPALFAGMLHLLRHDNEENGVTCCKTIIDLIRTFRLLSEELVANFMGILQDVFNNIKTLVVELLSEDSGVLDSNVVLPSIRSFRVLAEMGMVIVTFSQSQRHLVAPHIQATLPLNFEVLALEAPAQKKAREDVEAMGGFWAGMSSTIKNPQAYTDFINAQIKMVSYLAYILRGLGEQYHSYGNTLLLASLRLLQDIPANAIPARRDFMIVFRHLLGTEYRRALLPQIDKLFDETVLLGTGAGSRETLRATAFAAVADLVHHLRADLSARQLAHIINVYSRLIHNHFLPSSVHTLAAKMMFNLIDTVVTKDTPMGAATVLTTLVETCVDKLESVTGILEEVGSRLDRSKTGESESSDLYLVEKARPVAAAIYAVEKPEDVLAEIRLLFRTFNHGFRVCLGALRKIPGAPSPDGSLILRLFEGCVSCMTLYDADPREASEAMDWLAGSLMEVNLHIFQEVWTQKIGFFFEAAQKRPYLLHVCQTLFSRDATSPTLVAIVLRHLISNLPQLGEYDDATAVVTIRLFKLAFGAVNLYPVLNEPILASYLSKLIMECFPLAARATKPTNYYHLLRGLFRAIGGGGGRFELLYKEVLPLLPEMLENLNRQLLVSEGYSRDMIVELCLTVPLRLTHLLPHLSYLMKPLALALRGSTELVAQGLRTLELCIDNLTPDFLDPTLNTVLRELMEALQSHLRPLPANHQNAHTTLRILGKLGGRNRRLLDKEPELKYHHPSDPATILISFGGNYEGMDLGAMSTLATRVLKKPASPYRTHAYKYLEGCATVLLSDGLRGRDREEVFVRSLEGIFDCVHLPEVREQAETFIRQMARQVFTLEFRRAMSQDMAIRRYPSLLFASFLDGLAHGLSRENAEEAAKAREVVNTLIQDLIARGTAGDATAQDIISLLHQIAGRFSVLCLDEAWVRKKAGCGGIKLILNIPNFGVKWINDREVDLVRTLLHVLKDMPHDLPRDVNDVLGILLRVLRLSNSDIPTSGDPAIHSRNKIAHLISMFFTELSSSNAVVRRAADTCIELLSNLTGKPIVDLLLPHRDRMLTGIYTKPLRALPFPMQIGMIEAMRYCVSLDPPLPELNDELLRLLHEALALADADDVALLGRGNVRQGSMDITKLRVASIRLLTASMPITDFFSKQPQTRQRVTSVYFKSLYSPSSEVKDVAHEGLRMVLTHHSRLPKELLQTGLRPILMNLADPKRLSVPGLEGLARLLELLTNYFKVEIGHKLLEHFRIVADPEMLQQSSRSPLSDNEGITKLVRLANIFHLLPSAAHVFLPNLVNAIVQTEAQMHFSSASPFSVPLAKYLNRYPAESMTFFMANLNLPRNVRTLRSIIQARLAPNLQRELSSRTPAIVADCLKSSDPHLLMPGLQLCLDLSDVDVNWICDHPYAIDALLDVWRSETPPSKDDSAAISNTVKRHGIILSLFQKALETEPRIDLLFEVITAYSRNLPMDLIRLTRFLYKRVAFSNDIFYQRNVLFRFLTWFSDTSISWSQKTHFVRVIVTPIIIHCANSTAKDALLDEGMVAQFHKRIWQPMVDGRTFSDADDMFNIELLHLTTVIVQHYPLLLEVARKDIIKCAWHYITSEDTVVKQVAYLLAARFFDTFTTPQKFILRAWTGLLRPPHHEGRALVKQALDILAPALPRSTTGEVGYPQWAKTTRRLLAEESNGQSQLITVYQLIVRQSQLFYPVRALFIPHMVNSLSKLGLHGAASGESRLLSVDIIQTIFDWEKLATEEQSMPQILTSSGSGLQAWVTPLPFRESVVSYLVRLATSAHDAQSRNVLVPRALSLLRLIVGSNGWSDVTVKLNYFSRVLEQAELTSDASITQALATAKVLHVVASDKPDSWFAEHENAAILQRLVRKGMLTDDVGLHDALHPIFDRLVRLFPLPKEEDEQQGDMSEFHSFVYSGIGEGLRNMTALRGTLLMLKSVVDVTPERIEPFSASLMKLLSKLAKEHVIAQSASNGFESTVRLLTSILDICQKSAAFLGEQRKWFSFALTTLVEKSKSMSLCRYMLDIGRDWALHKREPYPTMKEKASFLQKMAAFENRGDPLYHSYLELIFDIYTEPSLRRSDLTTKLEQSFLLGCRARDPVLRERFMDLLDVSIPRNLISRLTYIFNVQSWEVLSDAYWIYLALHLLLGAVDGETPLMTERKTSLSGPLSTSSLAQKRVSDILRPMQRMLFLDPDVAHESWLSVFPAAWSSLSRREQVDVTNYMVSLLSKDYHIRQAEMRPNVIQTILTASNTCTPLMTFPPHLVKYLAKTFGAWHAGLEILQTMNRSLDEEPPFRDIVSDSLAELYAELAEDDLFYGLWRRRCMHQDTNIGIAFEQNGMWEQAATMYENAQSKTKTGSLAFFEPEYCLWEDHWILAQEKLQQWDTLYEFARNENNQELMLESAWRTKNWAESCESLEEQINSLPEVATPRRRVFEAFIALLKVPAAVDKNTEFTRILEDAMQLSLRKWIALPPHLSPAHIPLLQHFQQFVELQEAVQIFGSLSATNAQNLEKKSSDLKMVLQAWRERLPNRSDDISIWSDLVAWRQNVFNAINKAYVPLIAGTAQGNSATASNTNTYGYRGYHETAWIINRFAHVARKHDLLDVCFTLLNRIYTLPNIEISEAFLKLREQARCHYQKPNDLQAGLEVINNTNLLYFSTSQKAEFHTLKGMFHARFNRNEEANQAFGLAVQLDMTQAKSWAEWGKYNDHMFKEMPNDMSHAASAVSCYLQAAGLFKSGKSRPLLTRVLWLLSVDDGSFTISRAFDTYKGEAAFWYWITLIPQLCMSISQREVKQARYILLNLAKLYPQALFFQLRTTREDMTIIKKQAAAVAAARANASRNQPGTAANSDPSRAQVQDPAHQGVSNESGPRAGNDVNHTATQASDPQKTTGPGSAPPLGDSPSYPIRQGWEYVEEVVQILKTAFPLLILSMETMVDQINQRFKATQEEEIYRLICMLLQDAMQQFALRVNSPEDDGQLSVATVGNLTRMATNLTGQARKDYEEDFIKSKPSHNEYIRRLQQWRDRYEKHLDSRPRIQPLDLLSHYLTEFQYGKFDDIEIPGQYTEDKDSNQNFAKILKFGPKFENCRSHGYCWRRFTVYGSDNSRVSFAVQLPSGRHTRREERVMQVFRTFNGVLSRQKECRKRNLTLHIPAAISCSSSLRLLQNDSSYVTFGDIFEQYCESAGIAREDPILIPGEKCKLVFRDFRQENERMPNKTEYFALKKDVLDDIMTHMVPDTILSQYMTRAMDSPGDLWRMRKQFALQLASTSFMTYAFCLTSRLPTRFHLSRTSGLIAMSELLPGVASQAPIFASADVVPFRFTPNLQHFIGPVYTEGIMTSGMMAIGRALSEPQFDLEQQLCLFSRDEVMTWLHGRGKPWTFDLNFRQNVSVNIEGVVKRIETMSCKTERELALASPTTDPCPTKVPVVQTVINLIASATDPINLMKMTEIYSPWF
ncbi:FAT-domain-containing protein [Artomyces pyxidatus]|uniref:FAT-domain-containing protein n=1 Tax=Artomyces pyxidatus TaxID=48021 RepID=A0ACB8TKC2_9AGAM|nr:FAT-domain-containing protein [Artomyces pyxidatus]